MLKLIVVAVLAVVVFVAWKLFKAGKPVTVASVEAGVVDEAKQASTEVEEKLGSPK